MCGQHRIRTCSSFAIKSELIVKLNLGEVLSTNELLTSKKETVLSTPIVK